MLGPALGFVLVPIAWAVCIGATLLAVLLGTVLAYHWYRFAQNPPVATGALIIYALMSGFLLSGILAATVAIQIASP